MQKTLPSITILSIMQLMIAMFSKNKIVSPLYPFNYLNNVELIVPITAAIVFGKLIGGIVAALGYLLYQLVIRIAGIESSPIGVLELIYPICYFLGAWTTGVLSKSNVNKASIWELIKDIKTWFRGILNIFATIIGFAFIVNLLISFTNWLIAELPIEAATDQFLTMFSNSIILIITVVPLILIFYEGLEVIRKKRQKELDKDYRSLDTEIDRMGPAKVEKIEFDDHAFKIGQWTSINVIFTHTWKAARSYEIEAISTSRIYPHLEETKVLQHNESWTQTLYVLPQKQDHVDIKLRISPSQTKKFKQLPDNQTFIDIHGKSYNERHLLLIGVVILSEVVMFLFLFSILWSNIFRFIIDDYLGQSLQNDGNLQQIIVPWDLLIGIGIIEAILFIPFLLIMYGLQRPKLQQHEHKDLAFSYDITNHEYGIHDDNQTSKLKYFVYFIALLSSLATAIIGTIELIRIRVYSLVFAYTGYNIPIFLLISITLLTWLISVQILANIGDFVELSDQFSLEKGRFLQSIEPLSQFQINKSTEMLVKVKNTADLQGIRIMFEANDAISPPMIELHLAPGEIATFKIAITPLGRGTQEILAVIYPLFTKDEDYLDITDTKPLSHQNISYNVLGETILGITQSQARTLKHIFGWGSLIASTIGIANRYIGVEEAIAQWQNTGPWLVTLQIPFLYLYYFFSNQFLTEIETY